MVSPFTVPVESTRPSSRPWLGPNVRTAPSWTGPPVTAARRRRRAWDRRATTCLVLLQVPHHAGRRRVGDGHARRAEHPRDEAGVAEASVLAVVDRGEPVEVLVAGVVLVAERPQLDVAAVLLAEGEDLTEDRAHCTSSLAGSVRAGSRGAGSVPELPGDAGYLRSGAPLLEVPLALVGPFGPHLVGLLGVALDAIGRRLADGHPGRLVAAVDDRGRSRTAPARRRRRRGSRRRSRTWRRGGCRSRSARPPSRPPGQG